MIVHIHEDDDLVYHTENDGLILLSKARLNSWEANWPGNNSITIDGIFLRTIKETSEQLEANR